MTNLSKAKNDHYFINEIHQKFEKISLEICKNFNKKDTYLISTTLFIFRPQEQKSFYKTESNFSALQL